MAYRWPNVTRRMVFTWGLLGGLICLFAPPSWTGKLQLAYAYVFSWPLQAGHRLTQATGGLPSLHTTNSSGDKEWASEKKTLENHIANIEAQLREARLRIDDLSRLHVVPQWKRMGFLQADVIPGQTPDTLYITRGEEDGVAAGRYVMANMSIIGTVSDVFARRARVRLITDPASKLQVTIGESGVSGVLEGRSRGVAGISWVKAKYPIHPGDTVYAKKMPGQLDAPIIAGTVIQCRPDLENPLLLDITVEPTCNVTALNAVVVILPATMQD